MKKTFLVLETSFDPQNCIPTSSKGYELGEVGINDWEKMGEMINSSCDGWAISPREEFLEGMLIRGWEIISINIYTTMTPNKKRIECIMTFKRTRR